MREQTPNLWISFAQVLFFVLLPFLWWRITAKGETGFLEWIRSKRDFSTEENKRELWIAGLGLGFLALLVFVFYAVKNIDTAVTELLRFGMKSLPAIVIYSIVNTSVTEKLIVKANPSLFEKNGRSPGLAFFSAEACAEQVTGADGKRYKALASFTLHTSDKMDPLAAEGLFGLSTEEILEMLSDPLDSALRSLMEEYDGKADIDALSSGFRQKADLAVVSFGVSVLRVNEIRVIEVK